MAVKFPEVGSEVPRGWRPADGSLAEQRLLAHARLRGRGRGGEEGWCPGGIGVGPGALGGLGIGGWLGHRGCGCRDVDCGGGGGGGLRGRFLGRGLEERGCQQPNAQGGPRVEDRVSHAAEDRAPGPCGFTRPRPTAPAASAPTTEEPRAAASAPAPAAAPPIPRAEPRAPAPAPRASPRAPMRRPTGRASRKWIMLPSYQGRRGRSPRPRGRSGGTRHPPPRLAPGVRQRSGPARPGHRGSGPGSRP
jgi:hypothetical protein